MSAGKTPKAKVKVLKGLLSLKDMGGRRKWMERRKVLASPRIPERRRFDRRSGFDRRGILNCSIKRKIERRAAFLSLLLSVTPRC